MIVLPGLPKSSTENAVIEENKVISNNRPNPFPPLCNEGEPENPPGCTEEFTDDLQLLPSGTGILNVGGHNITIRNNTVKSNGTVGVGVVENPFGFGSSNNTRVTGNTIKKNGESPDPRTKGSGRHRLPGQPRKRKLHLGQHVRRRRSSRSANRRPAAEPGVRKPGGGSRSTRASSLVYRGV